MASIEIRNLSKKFGNTTILDNISLDIPDSGFTILVGASGCGKSTILRMIAGLEDVTSGDILIGGRRVNEMAPKDRDIAMVFQSYALYPHMTVEENMGFSLKLQNLPDNELRKRVREAADMLGLGDLLSRYPRALSGGQRQRVAMGRAIVREPEVFLFDEPLSNLDAKLRVHMRGEIKELHQRMQTTMVYVTHDQVEAMTMGDRIVVMNNGRIEQVGAPLELFDNPGNAFVASFLGSPMMNLLDGVVTEQGAPSVQTADGIRLPLGDRFSGQAGRKVQWGCRPEHMDSGGGSGFEARVSVVEPTGSDTHVVFRAGTSEVVGVFRERLSVMPGEIFRLSPHVRHVHLFDYETGLRI